MKSKNICKFIPESAADSLVIHNFICETDRKIIEKPELLSHNKALLTVKGSAKMSFDGSFVRCEVGDIVFGFEGETAVGEPSDSFECLYISFVGVRAEKLFRRFGINKHNRRFSGFEGLIPMWYDSLLRASELNIDLASESALLYAFSKFSSEDREKGDVVNKTVECLEEDFTDPDLSLSSVAEELGYNSKYLSHIFKEKMGVSFSEYLRTVRIKHAVMLFDHGLDSVKNVAFLSGFSDPLYFSSVFKSAIGISPKEYKCKMQNAKCKID